MYLIHNGYFVCIIIQAFSSKTVEYVVIYTKWLIMAKFTQNGRLHKNTLMSKSTENGKLRVKIYRKWQIMP